MHTHGEVTRRARGRRLNATLALAALCSLLSAVLFAPSASADPEPPAAGVAISASCGASFVGDDGNVIGTQINTLAVTLTVPPVEGPAVVAPGEVFQLTAPSVTTDLPSQLFAPQQPTIPIPVWEVKNILLDIDITGAAALGTPALSGGTVSSPSAELVDEDTVRLTLPGNTTGSIAPAGDLYFPGGSSFDTPELTLEVTAAGSEGTIESSLAAIQLDVRTNAVPMRLVCNDLAPRELGSVDVAAPSVAGVPVAADCTVYAVLLDGTIVENPINTMAVSLDFPTVQGPAEVVSGEQFSVTAAGTRVHLPSQVFAPQQPTLPLTVFEALNLQVDIDVAGVAAVGAPALTGGTVTSPSATLHDADTLRLTMPGNKAGGQHPLGEVYFPGGSSFVTPEVTADVTAGGVGTITASVAAFQLDLLTSSPIPLHLECTPAANTLGTVDVVPPPPPPGPYLTIDDVTITEGDTKNVKARFTVTLSEPVNQAVKVKYTTVNGTATSGKKADFKAKKGTLTIKKNKLSGFIDVVIIGDSVPEPTQTFSVVLSNPVGAAIYDGEGVGTILDTDAVVLTIDDAEIVEGDSGTQKVSVTVHSSHPSDGAVKAKFTTVDGTAQSTKPKDFNSKSGTVTIKKGQTSAVIEIPIVGDKLAEGNEQFTIVLSEPKNAELGNDTATVTIIDDDAAAS